MNTECPFCTLSSSRILTENASAYAILDNYPVSIGHMLVIPKRHIQSLFDTTGQERSDLWALLAEARDYSQSQHQPDGFNIGINDGSAAGQTVAHLHIHLIPRYSGDMADPRGGVRWIFPEKAKYWD